MMHPCLRTRSSEVVRMGLAALALAATTALGGGPSGGPFEIPWSTIDSGGALDTGGGSFTLSGTIGQPDAGGTLAGGSFALRGGFWSGIDAPCIADFTGDGMASFPDVGAFLTLFSMGDPAADLNGDGTVSFPDVGLFLSAFAQGCP